MLDFYPEYDEDRGRVWKEARRVFRIIFTAGWTLLHVYVFWRLTTIPYVTTYIPRTTVLIIGAALWAVGLSRRYLDDIGLEALQSPVELFVMNWLGTLFLVFICLLVADLVTLFGLLFRNQVPVIRGVALVIGILMAATAFVQALRPPVVNTYEVTLEGLPVEHDGLIVAVISDTHLGEFIDADWLAARLEQIKAMEPDLVLMLGDMFEGDSPEERQERIKNLLGGLNPPLGVMGVTGNHERHGGLDASVRFIEESGVNLLRNEWVEVVPGLAVGGVDDGHGRESRSDASDRIARVLDGSVPEAATILMSHRPRMVNEAASAGIDLMLCGHTHGGQIWPFDYLSATANPLLEGRYEIDGMTAIVTRGAGTWGPRMRLWTPGEILRIILRSRPHGQ